MACRRRRWRWARTRDDRAAADAWLAARGIEPRIRGARSGVDLGHQAVAVLSPSWPRRSDGPSSSSAAGTMRSWPLRSWPRRRAGRTAPPATLELRASAALIERASVLVTNDSAPLHLATAVGTPVVALFGPTVPALGFGPRGAADRALGDDARPAGPARPMAPRSARWAITAACGTSRSSRSSGRWPPRRRGGSPCDTSWALISGAPTSSSAAWPRTAPRCMASASEPTHAEAGASDVLDRLVALAQRTMSRPAGPSPARRSSGWASGARGRSTPSAASCC